MSSNGCEVWKVMETITRGSEVWQKLVSPQLGAIVNAWRCVVLDLIVGFGLQQHNITWPLWFNFCWTEC
jgi:hypothetical protein